MTTGKPHLRARSVAVLVGTIALSLTGGTPALASPPSDELVVAPGRIGNLLMGSTTARARDTGWIKRDPVCGSWTAGSKAVKSNRDGEVFKAFPGQINNARVLSVWAAGKVRTTRGIRTGSLQDRSRRGSSLKRIRAAYPNLQRMGSFRDVSGLRSTVYTTGSRKRGWLDFHIYRSIKRLNTVLVRTDAVSWRFTGASGC